MDKCVLDWRGMGSQGERMGVTGSGSVGSVRGSKEAERVNE